MSRDQWKEKIENAKTLRKFDLESNKVGHRSHSLHVTDADRG